MKSTPWQYGVNPNPKNWREAADVLKSRKPKKPTAGGLMDRLGAIEHMLKDTK